MFLQICVFGHPLFAFGTARLRLPSF